MKEATLLLYRADKNALALWRGEVIDKHSGICICRTARVPSRSRAMLDGATHALDLGYLLVLDDIARTKTAESPVGTAFATSFIGKIWSKFRY